MGQKNRCLRHILGVDRSAQQIHLGRHVEVGLGLRPTQVHQAGGHGIHPNLGGQALGLQAHGALQAQLGQGVGKIIGVEVEHLLVQHMHHAGLPRWAVGMQAGQVLAHVHGREQVHPQLLQRQIVAEVVPAVGLKQGGVVDNAAQAWPGMGFRQFKNLGHRLAGIEPTPHRCC